MRPGPWLRLTALAASAATLLAVVSGTASLGTAHRALAALAVPPLAALVVAAWVAHRRLLVPSLAALVLFGTAAAVMPRPLHIAFAALAFAASAWAAARSFEGAAVSRASARDYLTLTKPRIMSLLLLTGAAGAFAGAHGRPSLGVVALTLGGLALACGGASAQKWGGVHRKTRPKRTSAANPRCPVATAQPTSGGTAPAAPPMTMFCGVERFSQRV